jgi:hypothetical protein
MQRTNRRIFNLAFHWQLTADRRELVSLCEMLLDRGNGSEPILPMTREFIHIASMFSTGLGVHNLCNLATLVGILSRSSHQKICLSTDLLLVGAVRKTSKFDNQESEGTPYD